MKSLADVENYSISHKLESSQPKNKKKLVWENIFLHLSANFELNIQNAHHYRNLANGLVNGPAVIYIQKSKIG